MTRTNKRVRDLPEMFGGDHVLAVPGWHVPGTSYTIPGSEHNQQYNVVSPAALGAVSLPAGRRLLAVLQCGSRSTGEEETREPSEPRHHTKESVPVINHFTYVYGMI